MNKLTGMTYSPTRMRFTIRGLMIAVAVVAGLLALPGGWGFIAISFSLIFVSWYSAEWLFIQAGRRVAASTCH